MLLVDDVLLFPFKGLMWVFEEIYEAAEQDRREEGERITHELQELYAMLESGEIDDAEFDRREVELLDRLDRFQESVSPIEEDDDEEDLEQFEQ
jgi:hypothetical protein